MDENFRLELEKDHPEYQLPKTSFFSNLEDASHKADSYTRLLNKESAKIYEKDENEWLLFAVWVNGQEYSLQSERIRKLLSKNLTMIQARRYQMFITGVSMDRIAKIEETTKSAAQSSINQAREKLSN